MNARDISVYRTPHPLYHHLSSSRTLQKLIFDVTAACTALAELKHLYRMHLIIYRIIECFTCLSPSAFPIDILFAVFKIWRQKTNVNNRLPCVMCVLSACPALPLPLHEFICRYLRIYLGQYSTRFSPVLRL